ncbi:MAG: hypothetical protein J6U98_09175, partial [Abditibacteriota bacterium]|nr:hypothetical protein [Abditibacteriota bacterium]
GWEFIRWLTAGPEGTKVMFDIQRGLPAYKKSKAYDEMTPDSPYWPFYQVLVNCKHQRPVMPAQALLMGELGDAVEKVIYGRDTAENVLKEATKKVQTELDLRLAGEKN